LTPVFVEWLPIVFGGHTDEVVFARRFDVTKWACFLGLTFALVGCSGAKAPENTIATDTATGANAPISAATSAPAAPAEPVERFTEVTIPSGTTLRLELASAVGSDTSRVEEPVRATIRTPVTINGQVVVPAGSEVTGVVSAAEGSGRVKGRASVGMRFSSLRSGGRTYDIRTSGYSQVAAATKGEDATKIAIGAGAGAALGAILGGGGGAAKGAAIGGAGGTGVVLATKGKEVHLGPGANITTRLTAPVIVRVRS
jgi:hypothetical protein